MKRKSFKSSKVVLLGGLLLAASMAACSSSNNSTVPPNEGPVSNQPSVMSGFESAEAVSENSPTQSSQVQVEPDEGSLEGEAINEMEEITFNPIEGTKGFEGENFENLFDKDTSTKWCCPFEGKAYVVWKLSRPAAVEAFSMKSGNDNSIYAGRNPGSYRLLGTNEEEFKNGVWVVLLSTEHSAFYDHDNDDHFVSTTHVVYGGELGDNYPEYQYYRLEISETTGSDILQFSEIDMAFY